MNEQLIIQLYWNRSEKAITETAKHYGNYCFKIAYNILNNNEDSEECVNDTYLKTWNTIPPKRPSSFAAFIGKITRNLALDRFDRATAQKRGGGQVSLALEELRECIPDVKTTEDKIEDSILAEVLNKFLIDLPPELRKMFMQRYWELMPIKDIAKNNGFTDSKVKMSLKRTREELKCFLEKEGVEI